ncbi:MAG: tetraacyldisaccharide 4'-kinase [Candidatus Omnitrophica bacterium]|nr:tetraacyldisaccharide 4'-kinase [Candidatus Omnitrophota bacterium]
MRDLVKKIAEEGPYTSGERILASFLRLASCGYRLGVWGRERAFENNWIKIHRLPIPVVSVGNLTWGGTGKTPFVKFLTHKLEAMRNKVLILTRGYSHDEVRELELGCPEAVIGVGKNRYEAARKKLSSELPEIAVLDDGFQHRALYRDLDIVLINGARPFGSGNLIPRGNLREPLQSLCRANLIVITHADENSEKNRREIQNVLLRYAPNAGVMEAVHVPERLFRARDGRELGTNFISGKELISVSGIGFPESFNSSLAALGATVKRSFEFADHYTFDTSELETIGKLKAGGAAEEIVVTEKDFLRAPELITETLNPLVLGVGMKITSGERELDDRLHRVLAR